MFLTQMNSRGSETKKAKIRRVALGCLAALLGWSGWSFLSAVRMLSKAFSISFRTAASWVLHDFGFFFNSFFSVSSLFVGIAIGLAGYFINRKLNARVNEEGNEEDPAEKTEEPAAEQEEIIETTHYMFH